MPKRRSNIQGRITSKGKRSRLNRIIESHKLISEPLETSSNKATFIITGNDYQRNELHETTNAPNMTTKRYEHIQEPQETTMTEATNMEKGPKETTNLTWLTLATH